MTYNVHSCKGRDGRVDAGRVASVIDAFRPDVVGLQEVRRGRPAPDVIDHPRHEQGPGQIEPPVGAPPLPPLASIPPKDFPGAKPFIDQPAEIARLTGMRPIFYPLVRMEHEDYGIALLSRHPAELVRAANLPTLPDRPLLERRGAIWASVTVAGRALQVVNTHLGLNRAERLGQVAALLGPEWALDPRCRPPLVVMGDFNALPFHRVYRLLGRRFLDVQRAFGRARPTFPSRFPLLRIDHILAGPAARVLDVEVPRTGLTKAASDHLPIVADLEFDGALLNGN